MADVVRSGSDGQIRFRDMGNGTIAPVTFVALGPPNAIVILNAASATGAGTALDLSDPFNLFSMVLSGTATSAQVDLEGSLDNSHWVKLTVDTAASVAANRLVASSLKPVRYVRANVISVTGGNVTATLMASN